jgi:hypothetical protein
VIPPRSAALDERTLGAQEAPVGHDVEFRHRHPGTEIGMENGALGGKLVGAGSGGFLLFYAKDTDRLRRAFASEGSDRSALPASIMTVLSCLSAIDMQCLVLAGGLGREDAPRNR